MYSKVNIGPQQGFSLPIAIFILVILALLAAAAVSLMDRAQSSVAQEVLSTRAFYAAESGAQHNLNQLFPLNGAAASCVATSTLNFTVTGLSGCSASMTCSASVVGSRTYYRINSTGRCSSGGISSVRQLEISARSP